LKGAAAVPPGTTAGSDNSCGTTAALTVYLDGEAPFFFFFNEFFFNEFFQF
jgi:hypothetical protein